MSTIEKLSIRGIRSFGTDAEDEQKITFSSPLTLILGANGCGKTTIIECLKYALTGELPPGCNKGQSFVHDPKLFNGSECLGQVKLQIRNIKNDKLIVSRSVKTTLKNSVLKFGTLDSTLHIEINGKAESISKRCIDIDVEVAQAMGVSKPIINNVLFCHQEDSDWPLDKPQKLKEKFDEIFGTSEYNKAIDKIIKLRKNYEGEVKIKAESLKHFLEVKKDTEEKNLNLQNAEKKLSQCQVNYNGFSDEMVPIRERLDKIRSIENEISKMFTTRVECQTKLDNNVQQQDKLLKKIKTPFGGSLIMLEREIREFKEGMSERESNLNEYKVNLSSVNKQKEKIESKLTELERRGNTLTYKRQQEQDFFAERAKLLIDLTNRLDIFVGVNLENDSQGIDEVFADIEIAFKCEETKISNMSENHDKVEKEHQEKIDKLREEKVGLVSEMKSQKKQAEDLKTEQVKIHNEVKAVEQSASQIKHLALEISKLDRCYDEMKESVDLESVKKSIDEKRLNRNGKQEQLEKIDEQMIFLNKISKATAEISMKEKQLESRETECKKVKNKHSDNLRRLLNNETIESNYKRSVQTTYQNLQRNISDLNKQITRNQQTITEFEIIRKNQKEELLKMEKELQNNEDLVYEHCHSSPFIEVLERVKENVTKYQFEHGTLKSSEVLYKKYMEKLKNEPCCPLCHKDMNTSEVSDLSTELQDEIRRLPENMDRAERLLKTENRKYEALLGLQPIVEKIERLKLDIPKLKQNLRINEEKLSTARNDFETNQMLLAEPNINLELANSMLGDMGILDEALRDCGRIQQELESLRSKLPQGTSSTTMTADEAQNERTLIGTELKSLNQQIDSLQKVYDERSTMIQNLREKRNSLKDQQIRLQENAQGLPQMKARQEEIDGQLKILLDSLNRNNMKLQPLDAKLKDATSTKEIARNENRQILEAANKKLNEAKRIDNESKRCSEELKKLADMNLTEAIEQLKEEIKERRCERKEKITESEDISKKVEKLRQEIDGQASVERDLLDNKELKILKSDEVIFKKELEDLQKNIGDLDFRSVSREKENLNNKLDEITEKRSKTAGQMGELKHQVERLSNELKQPKYLEAVKNYREALYEHIVLKKMIADLGQYRVALEWALLKYHSEKMEKVNRLIRELWRSIYRGNDIDFIQIKTDENKAQSADKKRSYDYRVVQSKHDVELDLRGRCSAGQRVLACLVIRIALAETFSSNCGVLALDEPTTNLDRINIMSLCEALNKIVEERQAQSNFMLLVITHDEEFITTLGKVMNYFKVSRTDAGKSVITKMKVY